jgi:hypothetical protein
VKTEEMQRLRVPKGQIPYISYEIPQVYIEGVEERVPSDSFGSARKVQIYLFLIRIKELNTDLLVWMDVPHRGEQEKVHEKRIRKLERMFFAGIMYNFRITPFKAFHAELGKLS